MRILLVNKYHYVRGGSETYYFGLAELLRKAGHEVLFFAMQDERNVPCTESDYFVSNVDFNADLSVGQKFKAGLRMVYSTEAKRKLERLIIEKRPDIIHINLFHRVMTASIVDAAKKYHIPVVFTMHDLNCICPNHTMLDHGEICEACLKGNYLNCVKRVCFKDSRMKCLMAAVESEYNKLSGLYNKIDLFITPSEFYQKKLKESGITSSRIVHMKNFLPPETVYQVCGQRGDYVLYYGRLSREKGILTLVRAMQYLPGKRLVIVGTGPEKGHIEEEIERLNLSDFIELVGFRSGAELWEYVDNAACVVVPSEWYEASGYTACEAQARGKPVIATDAGGLPENIIDGKTGYICPMKDPQALAGAIEKIFALSNAQYDEMAKESVKHARELFNSESYIIRLARMYCLLS